MSIRTHNLLTVAPAAADARALSAQAWLWWRDFRDAAARLHRW
jgi:hypothetical protein